MKLYYFKPKSYGETAAVCANSKEEAIQFLKNAPCEYSDKEYQDRFVNEMINCLDGYTIEEFDFGQVLFSELG